MVLFNELLLYMFPVSVEAARGGQQEESAVFFMGACLKNLFRNIYMLALRRVCYGSQLVPAYNFMVCISYILN